MAGCPGCHLASWSLQVRGPYVFEVSLFFKRWCLDGVSEPPVVELRVSRLPEATQICSPNHPVLSALEYQSSPTSHNGSQNKICTLRKSRSFQVRQERRVSAQKYSPQGTPQKHLSVPSSAWGCTCVDDHRHPPRAEVMLSSLFLLPLWHYHQAVFHVSV